MATTTIEEMNKAIAEAIRQLKSAKTNFEKVSLLDSIGELSKDIASEADAIAATTDADLYARLKG